MLERYNFFLKDNLSRFLYVITIILARFIYILNVMCMKNSSTNESEEINAKPQLVRFLVNSVLFELSEELLQKRASTSILACKNRRERFYDIHTDAYVFDQPADAFEVIVYFICTGLLSRPNNVNNLQLYACLCFFEMDDIVINTYKKMEHLAVEANWEKTYRFAGFTILLFLIKQ